VSSVGCFGRLRLRMPRAGPRRWRSHQDVHVQMRFYKVAEAWAVDELDPIVLLGFDPASCRKPRCGDENAPARAFLIMAPTSSRMCLIPMTARYLLAWTIVRRRPPTSGSRLDHCIDAVIARTLGSPTFQSARFQQLSNKVLEVGWRHLG
jgi:hypothetical protein